MSIQDRIKNAVIDVPNFPKSGIMFKDISGLLSDQTLCNDIVSLMAGNFLAVTKPDAIVALESRGFMTGMLLANRLNVPFIMARKIGKLPGETYTNSYDLEYGSETIQIQKSALKPGMNILIHDDILATGGTAKAVGQIVKHAGANLIGFCFIGQVTIDGKHIGFDKLKAEFDLPILNLCTFK